MDKKRHKHHFDDNEEHMGNKYRKQRQREIETDEDDLGFDDDDDVLYQEVKRFLR